MAIDLAIDYNTGDLLVSPNNDIDLRFSEQTIEQRIRVRLKMRQGQWLLDPSNGRLGSRIHETFRLPVWRTLTELSQIVKEALAPMRDITVNDVTAEVNAEDPTAIDIVITYALLDQGGAQTDLVLSTSLTIEGY